jgi:folate-binding protein YgfZ
LALLLQPSGKLEALVRLWRTDEHVVVVDADAGAADAVEVRLRRFLLRAEVSIERLGWDCVAVRGPDCVADGGSPAFEVGPSGAELVGLGLWPGVDGVDLLGRSLVSPPSVPVAQPGALETLRIRSGWPAHGAELAGEHCGEVIPAEVGPWLITAAVSFTKGCYVGQELTARINARGGNVPRRLRTFELPGGTGAEPGATIVVVGDGEAGPRGVVTSAAVDPATGATVAMGYVHRSVPDDATLAVA